MFQEPVKAEGHMKGFHRCCSVLGGRREGGPLALEPWDLAQSQALPLAQQPDCEGTLGRPCCSTGMLRGDALAHSEVLCKGKEQ